MVEVRLAGFNIDIGLINEVKRAIRAGEAPKIDPAAMTPETISAAYARISRDPRSVTELREESLENVAKARKSNQTIVFGMGHHSVAEHALFNFDVLGLSRLGIEFLEQHRLGSYTEKSQRYVTMEGDFIVPPEMDDLGLGDKFADLVVSQNALYRQALPILTDHFFRTNLDLAKKAETDGRTKAMLEGWAKEDARYVLSLATEGQIGVSFNARTLEHVIRRGMRHPLTEINDLSKGMLDQAIRVAPSLIVLADEGKFSEAYGTPLDQRFILRGNDDLRSANRWALGELDSLGVDTDFEKTEEYEVKLIGYDKGGEAAIIAELLKSSNPVPHGHASFLANRLLAEPGLAQAYIRRVLDNLGKFDALPRAFEMANASFSVVMSSSCFAQTKRHRMMTLLPQDYDPNLNVTIPRSVTDTGLEDRFREVIQGRGNLLFNEIAERNPYAAPYALSNAHQRRVVMGVNVRELYHISRMREDSHAQWDIRQKSNLMLGLARAVYPTVMMLSCGKHEFDEVRGCVMGDI